MYGWRNSLPEEYYLFPKITGFSPKSFVSPAP
jgi:hypothetical protein